MHVHDGTGNYGYQMLVPAWGNDTVLQVMSDRTSQRLFTAVCEIPARSILPVLRVTTLDFLHRFWSRTRNRSLPYCTDDSGWFLWSLLLGRRLPDSLDGIYDFDFRAVGGGGLLAIDRVFTRKICGT